MDIQSKVTVTSKLYPEVSYTIRRLGFIARSEIEMQHLPLLQRQTEINMSMPQMSAQESELREQLELAWKKLKALTPDKLEAITQASAEIAAINADIEKSATTEDASRRAVLYREFEVINNKMVPTWIETGLLSVDGLTVDGEAVPINKLCATDGLSALVKEIFEAILKQATITGAEAKNSQSPSTLAEAEPKANNSTTAEPANTQATSGGKSAIA
jgi:hypothetical protein